jgi:AraC family transcriptional regulator of adaptative response/methylated-DNA-[protein]-cysteine methyltransferase
MPLINVAHAWEAVLSRDRRDDGWFVYAVSSTHVYCRPSCPSRRPTRKRVMLFDSPQLAESAGYRACLRCRPQSPIGSEAEERVERAKRYLDDHAGEPTRFDGWPFTLVSVRFICNGPSRIGSGSPRRRTKVSKE